MTKRKPPDQHGKPGRPKGGIGSGGQMKCPNGHVSNQYNQCFDHTCEHYVRKGL